MKTITQRVKDGEKLVSDGAWGTFLLAKGLKPGECPELWNITRRSDVYDIAKGYVDAGANMVKTNSFGGSRFKLEHYGFGDRVAEFNIAAAQISREAAGETAYVIASIGPTGKILMMGDVTEDELYQAFREQAIALETGGADAILVETMSDLDEARIAVKAAKENTQCEVFCTMTFEKTAANEFRSMMGISPADMVTTLVDAGADIIGANCGNGIEGMISIVNEIRSINQDIPVIIHANAGLPQCGADGHTVFPESPDDMIVHLPELLSAGTNIIGGCCGTTPGHIHKISDIVKLD